MMITAQSTAMLIEKVYFHFCNSVCVRKFHNVLKLVLIVECTGVTGRNRSPYFNTPWNQTMTLNLLGRKRKS